MPSMSAASSTPPQPPPPPRHQRVGGGGYQQRHHAVGGGGGGRRLMPQQQPQGNSLLRRIRKPAYMEGGNNHMYKDGSNQFQQQQQLYYTQRSDQPTAPVPNHSPYHSPDDHKQRGPHTSSCTGNYQVWQADEHSQLQTNLLPVAYPESGRPTDTSPDQAPLMSSGMMWHPPVYNPGLVVLKEGESEHPSYTPESTTTAQQQAYYNQQEAAATNAYIIQGGGEQYLQQQAQQQTQQQAQQQLMYEGSAIDCLVQQDDSAQHAGSIWHDGSTGRSNRFQAPLVQQMQSPPPYIMTEAPHPSPGGRVMSPGAPVGQPPNFCPINELQPASPDLVTQQVEDKESSRRHRRFRVQNSAIPSTAMVPDVPLSAVSVTAELLPKDSNGRPIAAEVKKSSRRVCNSALSSAALPSSTPKALDPLAVPCSDTLGVSLSTEPGSGTLMRPRRYSPVTLLQLRRVDIKNVPIFRLQSVAVGGGGCWNIQNRSSDLLHQRQLPTPPVYTREPLHHHRGGAHKQLQFETYRSPTLRASQQFPHSPPPPPARLAHMRQMTPPESAQPRHQPPGRLALRSSEHREAMAKRQVKSLLNKLTVELFQRVASQLGDFLAQAQMANDVRVAADEVFNKAVSEPNFSNMYADMVIVMFARSPYFVVFTNSQNEVVEEMKISTNDICPIGSDTGPADPIGVQFPKILRPEATGVAAAAAAPTQSIEVVNFRREFLNRCQDEFSQLMETNALSVERLPHVTPENFESEIKRRKGRVLGNIRFIGELSKRNILSLKITREVARNLVEGPQPHEYYVECVCELLTTVGYFMESSRDARVLNAFFDKLDRLRSSGVYSSRILFKIQDLVELRASAWRAKIRTEQAATLEEMEQKVAIEAARGGSVIAAQIGHFETVGQSVKQAYDSYLEQYRKAVKAMGRIRNEVIVRAAEKRRSGLSTDDVDFQKIPQRRESNVSIFNTASQTEGATKNVDTVAIADRLETNNQRRESTTAPEPHELTHPPVPHILSEEIQLLLKKLKTLEDVDIFVTEFLRLKCAPAEVAAEFLALLEHLNEDCSREKGIVYAEAMASIYNSGHVPPQGPVSGLIATIKNLEDAILDYPCAPMVFGRLVGLVVAGSSKAIWERTFCNSLTFQSRAVAGTQELLQHLELSPSVTIEFARALLDAVPPLSSDPAEKELWISSQQFSVTLVAALGHYPDQSHSSGALSLDDLISRGSALFKRIVSNGTSRNQTICHIVMLLAYASGPDTSLVSPESITRTAEAFEIPPGRGTETADILLLDFLIRRKVGSAFAACHLKKIPKCEVEAAVRRSSADVNLNEIFAEA